MCLYVYTYVCVCVHMCVCVHINILEKDPKQLLIPGVCIMDVFWVLFCFLLFIFLCFQELELLSKTKFKSEKAKDRNIWKHDING